MFGLQGKSLGNDINDNIYIRGEGIDGMVPPASILLVYSTEANPFQVSVQTLEIKPSTGPLFNR
jgi:hypothetical protein